MYLSMQAYPGYMQSDADILAGRALDVNDNDVDDDGDNDDYDDGGGGENLNTRTKF